MSIQPQTLSDAAEPLVTVVMSPRERFSGTRRSIASIYQNTHLPFAFICVDGGSPRSTRRHLANESRRRGFRLIRTDHYLTPNEPRTLALPGRLPIYLVRASLQRQPAMQGKAAARERL